MTQTIPPGITADEVLKCKKTIQKKNEMEAKYGYKITTEEYMILRVMTRRQRRKALLGRMKSGR